MTADMQRALAQWDALCAEGLPPWGSQKFIALSNGIQPGTLSTAIIRSRRAGYYLAKELLTKQKKTKGKPKT